MKIAMATDDGVRLAGHAGQARHWVVFDCQPGLALPSPQPVELSATQVFHHWKDAGPHPLDDVDIIVARSAGDGFLRRMQARGVNVLLTGENEVAAALQRVLAGEALPDPRWDASLLLCKLRDLFSPH